MTSEEKIPQYAIINISDLNVYSCIIHQSLTSVGTIIGNIQHNEHTNITNQ